MFRITQLILGNSYNDFWKYNPQLKQWTQLTSGATAVRSHCLTFDYIQNRIILFGGYDTSSTPNNFYTFSISSAGWTQEVPSGSSPTVGSRTKHACDYDASKQFLYVQGGNGVAASYQDLWKYDFNTKLWSLLNSGNPNVQIYGHKMKYVSRGNSLVIILGYNSNSFAYNTDLYQYDFGNSAVGWTKIASTGSSFANGRGDYSFGFNYATGEFLMFGGGDVNAVYSKNFILFHVLC